jgi:protein SERAC1
VLGLPPAAFCLHLAAKSNAAIASNVLLSTPVSSRNAWPFSFLTESNLIAASLWAATNHPDLKKGLCKRSNDVLDISKVCDSDGAILDVLFIHGLTGDPFETWTAGPGKEYWPKWLCETFPEVSVYALGYPASIFEKWAKNEMNLHERANNMLEQLASKGIGYKPIALVTHSLGGILAKEILRTSKECSDDGWQRIAENTRLVAFLATPHTGASLASVIKFIAPRLSSKFIDLLANDDGYLTSLNLSYRELANSGSIATVSYYEKHKTKGSVLVVSQESADPGAGGTRPVPIDADHISICKPSNRDALVFTSLCRHLKAVLKGCPLASSGTFGTDDYAAVCDSDRRDLLQKLIDAGREHEYQKANDLQNKFAQRYYKLGLYTEAKARSDAILASVEQRFVTHVYANKICRGASDDEIANALQVNVIDALCKCSKDENRPSPASVLQALYFLMEQCYIQWDAT